jgi:N-acetylglucosaminyldiphosphoundecaprenol N-acetyl-beta-D-mannosaminyltransferase
MKIVGRYTGSYPKSMERNILVAIKKASPHFVLVGSGIRGREKWIYRGKSEFSQGVFLYSAQTFDIFSGKRQKVSREVFQKGREFLPDFARRPWRVFRSAIYLYYGILLLVHRLRKI